MSTRVLKIASLIAVFATLPCGCSKIASESAAPPKARLEEQLRKAFPKAELVSLTTEVRPTPDQVIEITCKARLKIKESLFKRAEPPRTGSVFGFHPRPFLAECLRRGLVVSDEQDRQQPAAQRERNLRLEFEPKLRDTVILEPTQAKGTEFDVYGVILAKRIVDRWEVSPFEATGEEPELGQPKAEFGSQAFVQGSAELERQYELVAELKKEREESLDQRDAPLLAFFALDKSLCATYVIDDRGRKQSHPVAFRIASSGEPRAVKITFQLTAKPSVMREFKVKLEPEAGFLPRAEVDGSKRYEDVLTALPVVRLEALTDSIRSTPHLFTSDLRQGPLALDKDTLKFEHSVFTAESLEGIKPCD